ncbi:MAG: metal ABC transporter permease [Verrucomicrobia bacterium]|nr:metal ABC transporter permease [Verrucomicrobiota bacterium]MBS0646583.1 metal ABC transporter permease [Verrucomicrobiota bacterium]
MNFLQALLSTPLLQMALLATLAASFAGGILGSYVVVKRIVSISGSISHSVLGGLGCALWLQRSYHLPWLQPIYGGLVAAILSALIIGMVHLHARQREDTVIAMIWSLGMAAGIIFASQTPGYNVELMNFLLGNALWVSGTDLILLLSLDAMILVCVLVFHRQFLAICFDERQAALQGLSVKRLYLLLLVLISLSIVLLIHTVGIVLVLSMLALPPSIAEKFSNRLSTMMIIAVGLNMLFCLGGMSLSYRLDWPTGATIALFSGAIYLLTIRFKKPSTIRH